MVYLILDTISIHFCGVNSAILQIQKLLPIIQFENYTKVIQRHQLKYHIKMKGLNHC